MWKVVARLLLVYLVFLRSSVLSIYHRERGILHPVSTVSQEDINDPDNNWIEIDEDESELPYALQLEQNIGSIPSFKGYRRSELLSPVYSTDPYATKNSNHGPPWRRASQKDIINEILRLFDQLESPNQAGPLTRVISPNLRPEFMGPISALRFPSYRPPFLTPPISPPPWFPPGIPPRIQSTFPPPPIQSQMWPRPPPVSLYSSRGQLRTSQTPRPQTNYPYGQSHPIIGPPVRYYYPSTAMTPYAPGRLIARKGPLLSQRPDRPGVIMGPSPRPISKSSAKHQMSPKDAGPQTTKSRKL